MQSSGLTQQQVADDLGIGLSTLGKWITSHKDAELMSGPHDDKDKGNCYDNAVVETFFKSLKAELIWRNQYETRARAQNDLFGYINGFYNPRRRHSYLCNISPVKFESMAA